MLLLKDSTKSGQALFVSPAEIQNMCGIAGIVKLHEPGRPEDVAAVQRMMDGQAHRGPDGKGIVSLSPASCLSVVLGHRRLAIIDLSEGGAQPMRDRETGNVLVYNGELYNYRELRRELEAGGLRFPPQSDTEVLLALYRSRGLDMLPQLRGMFAFGLWDGGQRGLLLARDPFGIKPLYYADEGRTLRFASQVKV